MGFLCLECRCSKSTLLEQYFFIPCNQVAGLILIQKMGTVASQLWPGTAVAPGGGAGGEASLPTGDGKTRTLITKQQERLRASKPVQWLPRLIISMNWKLDHCYHCPSVHAPFPTPGGPYTPPPPSPPAPLCAPCQ